MTHAARLASRALLAISGEEARPFLQGLVSNDVGKVGEARAIYGALLTAQGKYLHDFFLAERAGVLLLDCEQARRDDLKRRLTIYKLRAKAAIAAEDGLCVWALWGEGALARLGFSDSEKAGHVRPFAGGIAFVDPRLAALGARALLPAGAEADLASSGFAVCAEGEYDPWRLAHGVPDGSRDLEIEKSILLESNFEELNGVDFDKGCYIGQELTARTKYRGLVKKRLFPVEIEGDAPAPGSEITLAGTDIGTMRSAKGGRGLALLRLDAALGGEILESAGARLKPIKPEWLKLPAESDG